MVKGEIFITGLGKGLGALISHEGKDSVSAGNIRREIRKKRSELKEVQEDIEVQKKEVEELRKDLTIKLMLEGKVDKTHLFELEEELKYKFDLREKLEIDIEHLEAEINEAYRTKDKEGPPLSPEEKTEERMATMEIDIRMVKDLMFEKPDDDENEEVEGPTTSAVTEEGPSDNEAPEIPEDHVEDLKAELNFEKEAGILMEEAYGMAREKEGNSHNDDIPSAPRVEQEQVPANKGGAPVQKKPVRRRVAKTQKVKPTKVRKVKEKGKKDQGLYQIIERSLKLMSQDDASGAKQLLHDGLRKYPLDDELLYHLGNAFFMEGDLESAEIRFKKAVQMNPDSFRAYNNLGVVLKKKGEKESAIEAFNQALELNEEYERAWLNLGMLFMEIEPPMLNEAKIFLRRALECDPDLQPAKDRLEKIREMTG